MAIDPVAIREAVMSLNLTGDKDTGLLRAFGVILANNSVDFLIDRELEFIAQMGPKMKVMVEGVLIDAAQWCANATFGGIMASEEWAGLIEPHINNVRDRLEGLIAVTNCLGWGRIDSYELDEGKMELKYIVKYSYYIEPYLEKFGKADGGICYMWTGVAGGYMDLLFGKNVNDFKGEEVKCAAKGDEYCEFVSRSQKKGFGFF